MLESPLFFSASWLKHLTQSWALHTEEVFRLGFLFFHSEEGIQQRALGTIRNAAQFLDEDTGAWFGQFVDLAERALNDECRITTSSRFPAKGRCGNREALRWPDPANNGRERFTALV